MRTRSVEEGRGALAAILAAIDDVNASDPNVIEFAGSSHPRAQIQGVRATYWLSRLVADPSDALAIAVRGHHIRRWAIPRHSYPEGRAGYLRWRRDLKKLHADELAVILRRFDASESLVERVGDLVQRIGLGSAPEAQAVEDAACLVFIETDYAPLRARLGDGKTDDAVAKTMKKMSRDAISLIGEASATSS